MEFILLLGLFVSPPADNAPQYNSGNRPQFPPALTSAEFKTKEACEKAATATALKWKDSLDRQGMRVVYTCNPK